MDHKVQGLPLVNVLLPEAARFTRVICEISAKVLNTAFSSSVRKSRCCTEPLCSRMLRQTFSSSLPFSLSTSSRKGFLKGTRAFCRSFR